MLTITCLMIQCAFHIVNNMNRPQILFLIFVFAIGKSHGDEDDFDYLDTLGDKINAQVQRDVAPLNGLGDRINQQVQRNLQSAGIPTLGSRISQQVHAGMAPLNGLGNRINAEVQRGLEPVRALEIQTKMKRGVGGVTIAEHHPSGKIFILRNNQMFSCNGKPDWNQGKCLGTEEPFSIQKQEDWCYAQPTNFNRINDQLCLSTGSVSVSVINNVVMCHSNDNHSQVLFTSVREYKEMCDSKSQSVDYKYFGSPNDPRSVKIPNQNQYVKCKNEQENVCEFSESRRFLF